MSEHDEIRRMMDDYLDAFVSHDIARVMPHYALPITFIAHNGRFHAADTAQLERLLQTFFATLEGQDHRASRWDELHTHMLTPTCAVVSAVFSRLRGDGSVIETLGGTYQMVKEGGAWKVLTLAAHPASAVIGNASG